jgi:hypothetical protein
MVDLFCLLRKPHTVFYNATTNLHAHQLAEEFLFSIFLSILVIHGFLSLIKEQLLPE